MRQTGRSVLATIGRFFGILALVQLGVCLVVALICRLSGELTLARFGQGLVWAGALAVIVGVMSVKGQSDSTRCFEYQFSMSTTDQEGWMRTRSIVEDTLGVHGFMLVALLIGIFSILLGIVLGDPVSLGMF